MKHRYLLHLAAFTSAAFLTGNALAADAGTTTTQIQTTPSTAAPSENGVVQDQRWVGGSERMDNTNAAPLDTWMNEYAATHEGRISREDFLDQMGRRWDALDGERHGYLTPGEARTIYMPSEDARPPRTGSDAVPGYMGPGSAKGQ